MISAESLNERYGDDTVHFSRGKGDLTRMTITAEGGSCELYLHGAHVTSFIPQGAEPVLWMSEKSAFEAGKPIRGGIPVCFPWFGRHPENPTLPSHGFVRLSEWHVDSVGKSGNGERTVTLGTRSGVSTQSIWPGAFAATITVTVSEKLTVELTVKNPGVTPITITEALHNYFAVSDIRFVTIDGLDGAGYLDTLLENQEPQIQRGSIQFTAETDRPYLDTQAPCTIDDPGMNRRITVEKTGSETTVVWNPWIAKARRMEDFGDGEWTGMVCLETANALKNAVTIPAGATHSMSTTISVEQ